MPNVATHKKSSGIGTARNHNFDAVKGYLIFLVVVGHIVVDNVADNDFKAAIYFFHMPLFLAVTGYFVRAKTLHLSIVGILKKYELSLLKPYILAYSVYTALAWLVLVDDLTLEQIALSILYPFYHLWYVPAIFVFIFFLKFTSKIGIPISATLFFAFLITVTYAAIGGPHIDQLSFFKFIGDKRFYHYFFYFCLGYFIAQNSNYKVQLPFLTLPFLLYLAISYNNIWLSGLSSVLANVALISITLSICAISQIENIKESNLMVKLGRCSLPIYLWHVAPIAALKMLFKYFDLPIEIGERTLFYICISILMLAFVACLLTLEKRSFPMKVWLFGK